MNKNKRIAAVGMTAGLLAGGAAGLILEASGSATAAQTTPVTTPDTTAAATPAGGTTAATPADSGTAATDAKTDRQARIEARLGEILKPLVTDGTLTQEQADKVIAALIASGPMRGTLGATFTKAAETIGVTAADLQTAIQGGKTVAEVATANGKTGQDVIDALVADVKTEQDAKVADNTITQPQADTRLALATARITAWVNETQNLRMGGRDMGPRRGHRGFDGPRGMLPGFGGPRGMLPGFDDQMTPGADDPAESTTASTNG